MTIEAARVADDGDSLGLTLLATCAPCEIWQLPDGRAGVRQGLRSGAAGELYDFSCEGVFRVPKVSGVVLLDGGRLYWDHSAGNATYKRGNDRDFYLGTVVGDTASTATEVLVNLNARQRNVLSLQDSSFQHVPVLTAGTPVLRALGGNRALVFSATAEAQKLDLLSDEGFAPGANAIVEAIVNVVTNGDAAAVDFNVGVASGTHATDADSIAESLFIHIDGASVNINAESDDGTTEVAATDTTVDFTAGTPFEVWFDLRDPSDIQIYVNGALVLGSTVFKLNAATGPLKLLAHLEKSSDDSPGEFHVNALQVRLMEQD